jgi:site-specific recombinase XerD
MTDIDLIHKYIHSLKRRSLAENTLSKRSRSLKLFAEEVGLNADREAVEEWLDRRELSAKSRACWLSTLHCFYAWAIGAGHLKEDPTARIRPPKLRRRLPRPVTDKELTRLLDGANSKQRAMILLASLAGLRCCELASLRTEDVLLSEGLLRVVGKGDRERVIPMHQDIAAALQRLPAPSNGLVFGGMNANAVSHALGGHIHKMGITGGGHRLRHTFASNLYRSSRDLRMVQDVLGHESPQTTAIYCAFSPEAASTAIRALKVG